MDMTGEERIPATQEETWAALNDPDEGRRLTDELLGEFVAESVSRDRGATRRLAEAFHALAPDDPRRVLTFELAAQRVREVLNIIPEHIEIGVGPWEAPGQGSEHDDARTGLPVCMVTYDRKGEMFKSFDGAYSVYDNKGRQVMDGKNPYWSWTHVHAHDVQTNKMSRLKQVKKISGGHEMFVNAMNVSANSYAATEAANAAAAVA